MSDTNYQLGRWSLADLIAAPEGSAMDTVLADLEDAVSTFETLRSALSESIDEASFNSALKQAERIGYVVRQLNGYAVLWLSENTSHSDALAFRTRIDKILADAQNRTLFFELWWKALDHETVKRLSQASGDLLYYL